MRCAVAKANGWCGFCYAAVKGRSPLHRHSGIGKSPKQRVRTSVAGVKRPPVDPGPGAGLGMAMDSLFVLGHPTLMSYLNDVVYETGERRRTSTLTIFCEGGRMKLCLSDRDTNRTAWATGESLEDALASLELQLESGRADWRESRPESGRRK